MLDEYLDLTRPDTDLDEVSIQAVGFDCNMVGVNGKYYKGFILARSPTSSALTLCDVSFQYSTKDKKYPPRLTFRRSNAELVDKPVAKGRTQQRISFEDGQDGYREFWRMIGFLAKFKELVDIGGFIDRYQVVTAESVVLHLKEKSLAERKEVLAKYAEQSDIDTSELSELLTHRARKESLEVFRKLLVNEEGYQAEYRAQFAAEIKGAGDEAVWHHFLSSNRWIFGLSLDLRFIEDFVDEASVGIGDTANRGNPKADMLAWSDYTVLVELKTSDTEIFTPVKSKDARANTWSFSSAFTEGFSQCLAQRTDWEQSYNLKRIIVEHEDGSRAEIDKGIIRTIDPQVIFIIGNKDREIPKDSADIDVRTKRDTLERFIRNNRNVNIISYDELYRRAYHIVYGELPPVGNTVDENPECSTYDDPDPEDVASVLPVF